MFSQASETETPSYSESRFNIHSPTRRNHESPSQGIL